MLDPRIETALDLCYEAVAEPQLWTAALDGLSAAAGAAAAMFYPKDVNENAATQAMSSDYGGLIDDYVTNGWYDNHYRAVRGWPLLLEGRGRVITEHDLATDEERRVLPHYNELYLKWGFSGFAAIGFWVEGAPWCLPMLRSERQGFFTREEADRLAWLTPHLSRMIRLADRVEDVRATTGLDALAHVSKPAFLVEADGRLLEVNAPARALLAQPDGGLSAARGRLRAVNVQSDQQLQRLLSTTAIFSHRRRRAHQASPIRIVRPGRRPLLAEIVPAAQLIGGSARARAILVVTDPERKASVQAETLRILFDLTAAEAQLAARVAEGADLAAAAAALDITRSTARDRLKSIFQKTDTHRQAELVALLRDMAR